MRKRTGRQGNLTAAGAALAAMLLTAATPSAADLPVDLELVLAVDVSGSMDPEEQELQRSGYVEALLHPEVLSAIAAGIYGRVAIAYVEWAGVTPPVMTVPWAVIQDGASAKTFVDALIDTPIARIRGTSISSALAFSAPLFDSNRFEGLRRVIDVSGDGPNNMGAPVEPMRDAVLRDGIVINGLPIMLRSGQGGFTSIPDLDRYYSECVIGGPGSFVLPVRDRSQLTTAIRQKLVLEIAGAPPRFVPAAMPDIATRSDCMIGERQRRSWDYGGPEASPAQPAKHQFR